MVRDLLHQWMGALQDWAVLSHSPPGIASIYSPRVLSPASAAAYIEVAPVLGSTVPSILAALAAALGDVGKESPMPEGRKVRLLLCHWSVVLQLSGYDSAAGLQGFQHR